MNGNANILDLAITINTLASKNFCRVTPYNCGSDYRLVQITINTLQSHYRPNIQNVDNIQYPNILAPKKYLHNQARPNWSQFTLLCKNTLHNKTSALNVVQDTTNFINQLNIISNQCKPTQAKS